MMLTSFTFERSRGLLTAIMSVNVKERIASVVLIYGGRIVAGALTGNDVPVPFHKVNTPELADKWLDDRAMQAAEATYAAKAEAFT